MPIKFEGSTLEDYIHIAECLIFYALYLAGGIIMVGGAALIAKWIILQLLA